MPPALTKAKAKAKATAKATSTGHQRAPPRRGSNPNAGSKAMVPAVAEVPAPEAAADEYRRGVLTVCFITLLFASNSPALHAALTSMEHAPPPLMLNALCGIAALVGLLWGGPLLGQSTALPSTLETGATDVVDAVSVRAGGELGLLKFCGTTANLCGSP